MWNSRRVKRIVGSFQVVTATTLGISLSDIVEENTYEPISFVAIDKAIAQAKSDLNSARPPMPIHRVMCYYGSPEFFKEKYEKEQDNLKRIREMEEQEKIKRKKEKIEKEKENKEEVAPVKDKIDNSENKEGKENGDNR